MRAETTKAQSTAQRPDELEGPCRLAWEDEVEALRWGLKRDISLAADLADSTEEASNKEDV